VIFSGSLPATRLAVQDFDPFFLTFCPASLAGVLALILILGLREKRPPAARIVPLMMVSLGVVIGFPLLPPWHCSMSPPPTPLCFSAYCR
jgi:drug/metabolite transporter (DMT)-like permease